MIGDPYWVAVFGIVAMIGLLFWARDKYRCPLDEMDIGNLYMMYFWGAHSAIQITNEAIGPARELWRFTVRDVYSSFRKLRDLGYIEFEDESETEGWGFWDHAYVMTDAGEAIYKRWAGKFGYDYRDEGESPVIIQGGKS